MEAISIYLLERGKTADEMTSYGGYRKSEPNMLEWKAVIETVINIRFYKFLDFFLSQTKDLQVHQTSQLYIFL